MIDHTVSSKIETIPQIFKAAELLHDLGLIKEEPHFFVMKYIKVHPDLLQTINQSKQPQRRHYSIVR